MSTEKGFTLLELLVATGASLALIAAVGGFTRAEGRMVARETRRLELREAGRRIADSIARELRGGGFAPVDGSFDGERDGLSVAALERIEIRADLHGATSASPPDGVLDADSDERIGFLRSAARGTVSQTIGRQTASLTVDARVPPRGLAFRYVDACGVEITPAAGDELSEDERRRVKEVDVRVVLADGVESLTSEVVATLRNRQGLRCP